MGIAHWGRSSSFTNSGNDEHRQQVEAGSYPEELLALQIVSSGRSDIAFCTNSYLLNPHGPGRKRAATTRARNDARAVECRIDSEDRALV